MALKKLSITTEEEEMLIELAGKGLSSHKIAKKMKISQPTIYRNMQLLGLNKERNYKPEHKEPKVDFFSWGALRNSLI